MQTYESKIDLHHPALAGHFPNNPIVPGVILLGHVIHAIQQKCGSHILVKSLPNVKFLAPLLPMQNFTIALSETLGVTRFSIQVEDRQIAKGSIEYDTHE